jgi:hypothetical protein
MTIKSGLRALAAQQINDGLLAHGLKVSDVIPELPGLVKKTDYEKLFDLAMICVMDVDKGAIMELVNKWMEDNFNDTDERTQNTSAN